MSISYIKMKTYIFPPSFGLIIVVSLEFVQFFIYLYEYLFRSIFRSKNENIRLLLCADFPL